jgi:SAM-dependent methyltransferase
VSEDPILTRATDPRQYDDPALDWSQQGAPGTPSVRAYEQALRAALAGAPITAAVDIGCGHAPYTPLLRELGARRLVGIEPSSRSAAIARRTFPDLEVIQSPLERVTLDGAFDLAIAIMSFEHQRNLEVALNRVSRMLAPGGRFALISGDPDFHRTPRFDLAIEVRELGEGGALISTTFPFGTIRDIIRPPEQIVAAARIAGFSLEHRVPLLPTEGMIEVDPRWRELANRPFGHLLVLRRSTSSST